MNACAPLYFALGLILIMAFPGITQVVINPDDIPTDVGFTSNFFIESGDSLGVPVNVGQPGPNQYWDFTLGGVDEVELDEVIDPATAPHIGFFPGASRVVYGALPLGLEALGNTYRYERITNDGWYLMGFSVEYNEISLPLVFPGNGLMLMQLPGQLGADWNLDMFFQYTIPVEMIPNPPQPIPFDSLRFDVTVTGTGEVDAWGSADIWNGNEEVLRVYNSAQLVVDLYGIIDFFGFPIVVPVGEIFRLDPTKIYSWFAPDAGEIANITSFENEPNPDFTEASLVRRRFYTPDIFVALNPVNPPIEIPAQGGTFNFTAQLGNNSAETVTFDIWTYAVLPNNNTYPILNVPGFTLAPDQQTRQIPLRQVVPPVAPAGNYLYVADLGIYPDIVFTSDQFGFSKLGAAIGDESWTLYGWDAEEPGVRSSVIPTEFVFDTAYPNPFNSSTTVSMHLPVDAELEVMVFNGVGRQVATLAKGHHTAGYHAFTFDARGLASGIYFIRALVPGQFNAAQKVILVK